MIDVQETVVLMAQSKPGLKPNFPMLVADIFDVGLVRLMGRGVDREISHPRAAGMWAAREYGWTFAEIGRVFNRDPSTCVTAAQRAEKKRVKCSCYADRCDEVLRRARAA